MGHAGDGSDSARVIRNKDHVAAPWPNGRGWTRGLNRQPCTRRPGQPTWRLSLATIDTTGPFSLSPGTRRCLLLASNTSLRLSTHGVPHRLSYTDSVVFDGDSAVEVTAVSGVSLPLNLMTGGGVGSRLEVGHPSGSCDLSDLNVAALVFLDVAALVVLEGRLVLRQEALGRYDTLGLESIPVRYEAATVVRVSVSQTFCGSCVLELGSRGRRRCRPE